MRKVSAREADLERDLGVWNIGYRRIYMITDEGGQTYTISIEADKVIFTATHITPNPKLEIDSDGTVTTENTGTARDQ